MASSTLARKDKQFKKETSRASEHRKGTVIVEHKLVWIQDDLRCFEFWIVAEFAEMTLLHLLYSDAEAETDAN